MPDLIPLSDIERMSTAIAQSGLFGMKNPTQALALMLIAQAEGRHPATAAEEYDIIQGKACRKTHSVLARFQAAGGKVEWNSLTDQLADATFSHPAGGSVRLTWDIARAKQAGLTNKDNWKNYPRAMLRARVIAEGVRTVYPAAIGGMLVPEEARDIPPEMPEQYRGKVDRIDTDTGEIHPPINGKPEYPANQFEKNLDAWRNVVESGKKTPESIIKTVSSKYKLNSDQISKIHNLALNHAVDGANDIDEFYEEAARYDKEHSA